MEPTSREPFVFCSTAHIIELTGRSARSLPELRAGIAEVTGSSIFHHTFGALQDRFFAAQRFTSDFARWAVEVLQEFTTTRQEDEAADEISEALALFSDEDTVLFADT